MTPPARPEKTEHAPRYGSETGRQRSEPTFLLLGRVSRPHGLRGDLFVQVPLGAPPRLDDVRRLFLGPEAAPYRLQTYRFHRKQLLVKLGGVDDREMAAALRGQLVQISVADAAPLQPDEYYVRQLLGLQVLSESGELLGELAEVIATGANDVYLVRREERDLLLPAIKDVILRVDLEAGEMRVCLPPGLVEGG